MRPTFKEGAYFFCQIVAILILSFGLTFIPDSILDKYLGEITLAKSFIIFYIASLPVLLFNIIFFIVRGGKMYILQDPIEYDTQQIVDSWKETKKSHLLILVILGVIFCTFFIFAIKN